MPNAISEAPAIERFLTVRGWFDTLSPTSKGQRIFQGTGIDGQIWRATVDAEGWRLRRWDTTIALPDWKDEIQGETLAELEREAVSLGAVSWWCPNCGEEGGEPREFYDRYFYGADADGNRGEWREDTIEGCSKCIYNGRMVR